MSVRFPLHHFKMRGIAGDGVVASSRCQHTTLAGSDLVRIRGERRGKLGKPFLLYENLITRLQVAGFGVASIVCVDSHFLFGVGVVLGNLGMKMRGGLVGRSWESGGWQTRVHLSTCKGLEGGDLRRGVGRAAINSQEGRESRLPVDTRGCGCSDHAVECPHKTFNLTICLRVLRGNSVMFKTKRF